MNWLDLLIVAILAWTTFRAFSAGLIREVVALLSLVAGVMLAGAFYDNLATNLEFLITDDTTRRLAAFGAIFIGTVVAGAVLGALLRTAASMLLLGSVDRIGGAIFGLAKGLLLVEVLLIAISVFPAQTSVAQAIEESKIAPVLLQFAPVINFGLPEEFQNPLEQLRGADLSGLPGLFPGLPEGFPAGGSPDATPDAATGAATPTATPAP